MVKKKKVKQRVNTKGQHYHVGSRDKKKRVYRRLSPYDREQILNYRGENSPKALIEKIMPRSELHKPKPTAKDLAKVKGSSGLTTDVFFADERAERNEREEENRKIKEAYQYIPSGDEVDNETNFPHEVMSLSDSDILNLKPLLDESLSDWYEKFNLKRTDNDLVAKMVERAILDIKDYRGDPDTLHDTLYDYFYDQYAIWFDAVGTSEAVEHACEAVELVEVAIEGYPDNFKDLMRKTANNDVESICDDELVDSTIFTNNLYFDGTNFILDLKQLYKDNSEKKRWTEADFENSPNTIQHNTKKEIKAIIPILKKKHKNLIVQK